MKTLKLLPLFALVLILAAAVQPSAAQDADDAFPVTIEHKFGETTITEEPQRIVALGFTEQDPLYALGAEPVAIRYWYGDEDDAIFPWADEAAGDADPVILNMAFGTLNYEAIAELDPDLITAIDAGITADEYDLLSEIAPTLAQSDDYVDFGTPWQVTTRTLGIALGRSEQAEALITDVEAQLETVREQNPQFEGKTVAVAYNSFGNYGYYTAQDSRGRFFTDLGFVVPAELAEIAGDSFFADISEERLDLLDRDLLVFLALQFFEGGSQAAREAIENDPILGTLQAVRDDRVLYVSDEFDDALQFSTVLSIQFLLDNMVPEIAEVVSGSGSISTQVGSCDAGLRPFVDVTGNEVCVPQTPERIVAIHDINAGAQVLSLGGPLVGMASRADGFRADVARYFDLEGVADVGNVYEPNLESILALQPDLIVHEGFDGTYFLTDDNTLMALQEIAPVVAIDVFRPVEEVMTDYQMLLGDAATISLEEQQATFDERLAEIENILGDEWRNVTVSFIDPASDGTLQIWGPTALVPLDILTRVGVNWVPLQIEADSDENGGFIGNVSPERIDELNADLSLVDVRFSPEIIDSPLYRTLSAVRAGQVIILDEPFSGTHYPNYIVTAELLLERLNSLGDFNTDLVTEPEITHSDG